MNAQQITARFSFDDGSEMDEVTGQKAKCVGVTFIEDRFGNKNNAIFFSGHEHSYVNLGSSDAVKPSIGSVSLWLKVEHPQWSGTGAKYNPILLTKNIPLDDFYESFGIYYFIETGKLVAVMVDDSTREVALHSKDAIDLNKWYHLVITFDDTHFSFYQNGQLVKEFPKNFKTKFLSSDSVMLGTSANKKNNRWLIGAIDDVAFYNSVLSAAEVNKLFQAPDPNKNKVILRWIFLWLMVIVFCVLIYFFIRFQIKKGVTKAKERLELQNKLLEMELRVNRASMNPHFLFNSLNALHNFILANEIENASTYLVKFSKLIRQTLESNLYDNISLGEEIDLLQRYLDLENLRFEEDVKYNIAIDPMLVRSNIQLPIMMIQPFVENSIWHGLRDKTGEKHISIAISPYSEKCLLCVIEDNGTGRKAKREGNSEKSPLATSFIIQRLELLNKIHKLDCVLEIIDKPEGKGTIVRIILPILNKI